MADISQEVQKEVDRIKTMITESKTLLPNANVNFAVYEAMINEAERAVREQDTTTLVKILPRLQEMK